MQKKSISVFQYLFNNSSCCIRTETIETSVRQGGILPPFLFIVALDFVTRKAMARTNEGTDWDGQNRCTDLNFRDDIAMLPENT